MSDVISVLLVNKRSIISELDKAGYKKMGISVRSASKYAETIKVFDSTKIDVMAVSLDEGQDESLALIEHYRKQYPELAIIAMSIQSSQSLTKKCLDRGANIFIEQPIPREQFVEKLKQVLKKTVRDSDRVDSEGYVKMEFGEQSREFELKDLSSTGLMVVTEDPIAIDTMVKCSIFLHASGDKKPISVSGTVVREITKINGEVLPEGVVGLGVKFSKFHGDSKKRLSQMIRESLVSDTKMAYYL